MKRVLLFFLVFVCCSTNDNQDVSLKTVDLNDESSTTTIDDTSTTTSTSITTTTSLSVTTTTSSTTTVASSQPDNPGDTKNCGDFANYSEARSWYDIYFPYYGDVANLDGDNDGVPCESLSGAP